MQLSSADEGARQVEVVVEGRMDGAELLQILRLEKMLHGSLQSPKEQV
ncbi:hypothetical protein ABE454_01615 [Brevundimonas diminuta]